MTRFCFIQKRYGLWTNRGRFPSICHALTGQEQTIVVNHQKKVFCIKLLFSTKHDLVLYSCYLALNSLTFNSLPTRRILQIQHSHTTISYQNLSKQQMRTRISIKSIYSTHTLNILLCIIKEDSSRIIFEGPLSPTRISSEIESGSRLLFFQFTARRDNETHLSK